MGTNMSSGTERFLNGLFAVKAINRGVLGGNRLLHFAKDLGIVFHPIHKQTPCCITDGFSQMMIANHIPHLQVFIGNQVARHDQRTGLFYNPIFTLPTYSQVLSPQSISRFSAILGTPLLLGNSTLQTFQFALQLPQEFGIFYLSVISCLVEILQPQVNANGLSCRLNRFLSVNFDAELSVVAIGFTHYPNSLALRSLVEG